MSGALLGLLLVASSGFTACSSVRAEADDEAARVADHVLPQALSDVLARERDAAPAARRAIAERWLADPGPSVMDAQAHADFRVVGTEGAAIRVDLYAYVESGSFFPPDQGETAWGVACRVYDVAGEVTTTSVECPDGTPPAP